MIADQWDETMKLRFKGGALEQLFRHRHNGDFEWRIVPDVEDE